MLVMFCTFFSFKNKMKLYLNSPPKNIVLTKHTCSSKTGCKEKDMNVVFIDIFVQFCFCVCYKNHFGFFALYDTVNFEL